MKLDIFGEFGSAIFLLGFFTQLVILGCLFGGGGWGVLFIVLFMFANLIFNGLMIFATFNKKKKLTFQKVLMGLALFFASTFPLLPLFLFINSLGMFFVWGLLPFILLFIAKVIEIGREPKIPMKIYPREN